MVCVDLPGVREERFLETEEVRTCPGLLADQLKTITQQRHLTLPCHSRLLSFSFYFRF